LALLAVMVPLLSGAGLSGIGFLPAFLGLVLYSLLPILRNTVTGLAGVDTSVLEAADGVGMTPGQRLRMVELPLALPVILAGLRTATVWSVGMATLSTPVGAPSLGNYIFSGLQTRNYDAVLIGCIAAALLALGLDSLLRILAAGYTKRRPALVVTGGVILVALCVFSLSGLAPARAERPLRIGAKTFTEQYILAEVLARQIHRKTGAAAEVLASLGSTVAFDALVRDEIDAYVEYTGTIRSTLMHEAGAGAGRAAVLAEVGRWLNETHGLGVACSLGFENTYAFALRRALASELSVRRLSDLAPKAAGLHAAGDYEFWSRSEWADVKRVYNFDFAERRVMDPSLLYAAVAGDQVDVITAYSSDGRIEANDLITLDDDRGAIPPYDAVVLVSRRLSEDRPDVVAALSALAGTIDVDRMRAMNAEVDRDGKSPAAVAERFLQGGAADAPPAKGSFQWPVAEGWRKETMAFPLEFAKDLPFSGIEEIRFAPGMFKPDMDGYWSYAFVWWLDGRPTLGAAELEHSLTRYFAGLITEVAKDKGFAIDPARFSSSIRAVPSSPEKLGHEFQAFAGTVDSYDAFATGKPIVLNLNVWVWDCAESGKRAVMVLASPKPQSAPIWKALHARRDEFICHELARP
jgi:osmoprotectant transport system permease protein